MTAKIWRWPLHWQVLLGLVIGGAAGYAVGHWAIGQIPVETPPDQRGAVAAGIFAESWFYLIFDLIGDLFLNGLKMIIVPLVTSSIILAVYGMGGGAEFGKLGFRTLLYYMTTSVIAVLIGLTLINLVSPGTGSDGAGILVGQDLSAFEQDQQTVEQRTGGKTGSDFLDVFRQMLPENVIAAAAQGQLLG
ncbi:MAG TPA: cation:dicarboxylase symporter family transporter, partial [Tepidisphaeraceae bacterium]|nr:cation:dicarboxylase symporter family transporter [Tepidisphaeraceae bacterium]